MVRAEFTFSSARSPSSTTAIGAGVWRRGLAAGKSYVSDGYAHALEFSVGGVAPGFGDVRLAAPGTIEVKARVSFAPETPFGVPYGTADPPLGAAKIGDTVNLHIGHNEDFAEGGTRLGEFVVNGQPVALRHSPQLHTNPVNVLVGDEPIRASADSARWCIGMIETLWENREMKIREDERETAKATYAKARSYYESVVLKASQRRSP